MTYRPNWNLSTIPDALFRSEHGRRNNALRKRRTGGRNGGRPTQLAADAVKLLEAVERAKQI